jgi:beta-glucanase (GH16 family)
MYVLPKVVSVLLVLSAPFLCAAQDAPPPGYHLFWEDDFAKDPDGRPDPAKWSYEVGYVRNHEEQFYTKERLENCRVEHGQLIIEGRKETYSPPWSKPTAPIVAKYTSASINTQDKFAWQYGRLEVKAKLPAGQGVWPAIWGLGIDEKLVGWPKCGEIDVMELVGKQPAVIHGTMHYFANDGHHHQGGQITIPDTDTAFHTYAAEWTPTRIDLFVDDQKYFSFDSSHALNDGQNPFQKPFDIILNLALGGSWGGTIDPTIFPQRMTIDYVRVYRRNGT